MQADVARRTFYGYFPNKHSLLGGLGIHRFLLGDTSGGIIRIVITVVTCGIGSIIGLIEGIIYLTKSDAEFYQMYMVEKKAWF